MVLFQYAWCQLWWNIKGLKKKGLEPRGLKFVEELLSILTIPIFAIGGIDEKNSLSVINSGAFSICMMSTLMKY